ncbi:hypothetical protein M2175_006992 [Bradyrhizobium elkanii]|uniref:hypothetical protein n=1 Tax=Bradyrhizobium TaxID=374 RepID=UPI00216A4AAB|nr:MULTISPECIES: hypothetical protein [Bradyrhizobium]MCS3931961.1 hypothetical protein [Bradyrhizobium elkanii]MCS3972519.1 hypothetical protein [Bradyrhizobium japonicum]
MSKRRRFKQSNFLKDRLAIFAKEALKKASNLPPGTAREKMFKKVRQADIACHVDEWAHSRGPQPPTWSNDDP